MAEEQRGEERTYIAQGEQAVGTSERQVISTILGSCVSVCLWDRARGIGGMNHILVPDGGLRDLGARGVGATAMETLINAMMRLGAERTRLEAKVFGGASIVEGLSDIGARNAEFVFAYLENEAIPCSARSTGGYRARQIRYWPRSGRVQQRFVCADDAPQVKMVVPKPANGLEFL